MVRRSAWIATLLCGGLSASQLSHSPEALASSPASARKPAPVSAPAAVPAAKPAPAKSAASKSAPAQPAPAKPAPAAAPTVKPAPAKPAPGRPAVAKPVPARPAPSRPAPSSRAVAAPKLPRWETLPAPGPLPAPAQSGTFETDDVKLWYASFGEGDPVVLLHGGLGSSDHYGDIVSALAAKRRVLVVDSRGHGRSTRSQHGISYRQMADDVVALLDHLAIERAALVGWSDGGVTGLEFALRHPARLTRLLVLGTNYALDGMKPQNQSRTFPEYFARCRRQYAKLSPAPQDLSAFLRELRAMWASQPTFSDEQLQQIQVPVLVALGDHDEAIRLDHAQKLAKLLPRGRFVLLPKVSHFALWQDPKTLLAVLTRFLDEKIKAGPTRRAKPPVHPAAKSPRPNI